MEWIGFIAVIAIGVYLLVGSYAAFAVEAGFAGKFSIIGLVFFVVSVGLLYIAWVNKPFEIMMK